LPPLCFLVWQVKAQTQANQDIDSARQMQSQGAEVRLSPEKALVEALTQIGSEAKDAVSDLVAALKDEDAEVCRCAAEAL
jgi:hypothetical protein